jgi:putative redox protein
MSTERLQVAAATREIEATLRLPAGSPVACALLVHCLPESSPVAETFAGHLLDRGCAVLLLDAGLAASAAMQEALGPQDLRAAAHALFERLALPQLLIGHSYGGALALAVARTLEPVRAVVTINAPAGLSGFTKKAMIAPNRPQVGGQVLALPQAAESALAWDALRTEVEHLRRPLLILHAPMDNTAELASAAHLFTAAKHPKSFVALDSGDHLLSRAAEAQHAAEVVCAWAGRYLRGEAPAEAEKMRTTLVEESGAGKFRNRIASGPHRLVADEPVAVGGLDGGPSPYDLLCAALGACTSMTIRMYADMKKLPLHGVRVAVRHDKVHASDCGECETKDGKLDRIERVISLEGDLDAAQRTKLLEIANKCPVHRTLHSEVWIPTSLADD